ncbi:glycosyltransferase, partial [Escherichia coli]
MSCQCAVVGTNVGCMKDIGEHQETALLSEPYQIEEMAKNIELLIHDEKLLKKISIGGYQAVKGMTWENATAKFEKAIYSK